jgi:hypothetical protein
MHAHTAMPSHGGRAGMVCLWPELLLVGVERVGLFADYLQELGCSGVQVGVHSGSS